MTEVVAVKIFQASVFSAFICSGVPQYLELLLLPPRPTVPIALIYLFFKSNLAANVCRDNKKRKVVKYRCVTEYADYDTESTSDDK